jgi:hypothetical protein
MTVTEEVTIRITISPLPLISVFLLGFPLCVEQLAVEAKVIKSSKCVTKREK